MTVKLIRKFIRYFQPLVSTSTGGLHLPLYHLVGGETGSPVDLAPEVFRSQMEFLRNQVELCHLNDALRLKNGETFKKTTVAVTFDDGYENFYTHAFPVIQEFQIPVMLFVPVNFIDRKMQAPIRSKITIPPCSWEQIREMLSTGLVSIGSHSMSHPDLRRIPEAAAHAEISESREQLEQQTGVSVSCFAYPKALWSRQLENIVRKFYDSAVVASGTKMRAETFNPYRLSRIPIRSDMPADLGCILPYNVWLEERVSAWLRQLR